MFFKTRITDCCQAQQHEHHRSRFWHERYLLSADHAGAKLLLHDRMATHQKLLSRIIPHLS